MDRAQAKTMSADHGAMDALVWQCVRKNHAYIRKFNGIVLSKEKFNASRVHSRKTNGFRSDAIGVELLPRSAVRVVKRVKGSRVGSHKSIRVAGDNSAAKKVVKAVGDTRPDMIKTVFQAIKAAEKTKKNFSVL